MSLIVLFERIYRRSVQKNSGNKQIFLHYIGGIISKKIFIFEVE
jgi:hypothetical protein